MRNVYVIAALLIVLTAAVGTASARGPVTGRDIDPLPLSQQPASTSPGGQVMIDTVPLPETPQPLPVSSGNTVTYGDIDPRPLSASPGGQVMIGTWPTPEFPFPQWWLGLSNLIH